MLSMRLLHFVQQSPVRGQHLGTRVRVVYDINHLFDDQVKMRPDHRIDAHRFLHVRMVVKIRSCARSMVSHAMATET